jgi:hypothetical protein
LHSGSITSLDSDGFSVGSGTDVNADTVTYYWTAFDANSDMVVNSYSGDGSADQAISGVGFSPEYVIILGDNATYAYNLTSNTGHNASRMRNGGATTDAIISLDADGFTAGDGSVESGSNMNAGSVDYHYRAIVPTGPTLRVLVFSPSLSSFKTISVLRICISKVIRWPVILP